MRLTTASRASRAPATRANSDRSNARANANVEASASTSGKAPASADTDTDTSTVGPVARMFKPPEWEWFGFGEIGWWVRAGTHWRDALLGPNGLRLDEWDAQGRVTTIKSGPHRTVHRARLDGGAVYIKHFLVPNRRSVLRQWFRRGKGRNEGKRSRELAAIGVPTIWPVALGERRVRKFLFENYLITPEIADAVPLDEFVTDQLPGWPEPRRSLVRQRLATTLGAETARLHNAGFLHADFHPGNLLVRFSGEGEPELVMIDLDALRRRKRVEWKHAGRNLALLDHFFWLRSSRTDRFRFLKCYLKHRSEPPPPIRRFARGIEEATRAWAERLWTRWGRRCRSTNKYFQVHESERCWCVASRDLGAEGLAHLIADPDAPFRSPDAVVLKNSRTTTVVETTMIVRGRPARVIHKRFNRKKWLGPLLSLFRPSGAWRSWRAGQDLACRGLPTPQNLAFLSRRRSFREDPLFWFLPHESYLITIKEEAAVDLSTYIREVLPALPAEARRERLRRLVAALARLVRTLHERSISHRDLKASNVLVHTDSLETFDRLSLIDLVGVRIQRPVPRRRRAQNLARLGLSLENAPGRVRTDSLRFLRRYLPWGLSPLGDWKPFYKTVARAMHAKRLRNRRRNRPLS